LSGGIVRAIARPKSPTKCHGPNIARESDLTVRGVTTTTVEAQLIFKAGMSGDQRRLETLVVVGIGAIKKVIQINAILIEALEHAVIAMLFQALAILWAKIVEVHRDTIRRTIHGAEVRVIDPKTFLPLQGQGLAAGNTSERFETFIEIKSLSDRKVKIHTVAIVRH